MTTDGDKNNLGKDRTEAAFDALSAAPKPEPAPDPEPVPGNPWKPAALLLLLMALALPLAFGIRASRVRIEFDGRVADAQSLVVEVQRLADAGDLPGAVLALSEVTEALADVEGLTEATRKTRNMAVQKITDLRAEQNRVAERDARIDQNRLVVDALLAGDPRDATRRIKDFKRLGALEQGLETLSLRLDALSMISTVDGERRAAALELLATAWDLPIVREEHTRAAEEVRRARKVAGHLKEAHAALEAGELAVARTSFDLACEERGIPGIADAFARLRVAESQAAGREFESAGDYASAAACYELAGNLGLAELQKSKASSKIEAGKRQYLIDLLELRLQAASEYRTRAAIAWMLAELTGDSSRLDEAAAYSAKADLAQARTLRAQGELEAAQALAAAATSADGADALRKSVADELARNAAADRLKQADAVLVMGAPAYAAWLVAQNQEQPADVMRKIGNARLAGAVTEARARFDRGDLAGSRDALDGQPTDNAEVQELYRRLILATDTGSFVVDLPEDPAEARALLYRAILHRFQTDPVAAGKMLATYEQAPAGIVPGLAAFLDAADLTEERAVWQAVKAEVEKRFPQPEEVEPDRVE